MKLNLLIIILLLFSCCYAKENALGIEIVNDAEDYVGKSLVTKFRETIRASNGYSIEYQNDVPHFKVIITTMDRFKGTTESEGYSTIYSYIIIFSSTYSELYITSGMGYTGTNSLDTTAYSIFSVLDESVDILKKILKE